MIRVGTRRLYLAAHAIERYHERVRPALTVVQVAEQLEQLLAGMSIQPERPEWASGHPADEWIVLTEDIAFPIVAGRIVTCLTRGEAGAEVRIVRQEDRRQWAARNGRPGKRKKHGKVARDARRRARAMREAAVRDE